MKNPNQSSRTSEYSHIPKENDLFSSIYCAKPSRGLTLTTLQRIPKDLSKTTASSFNFARDSIYGNTSKRNEFTKETVSKFLETTRSKNKYDFIQSPTSHIYYTNTERSLINKDTLDFNYRNGQKFLKDATNCGIDKLSTIALRRGSPYKYACIKNKSLSISKSPTRTCPININTIQGYDITNSSRLNDPCSYEQCKTTNDVLSEIIDEKFSFDGVSKPIVSSKKAQECNRINNITIDKYNSIYVNRSNEDDGLYSSNKDKQIELIDSGSSGENIQEKLINNLELTLCELDGILDNSTLEERLNYILLSVEDKRMQIRLGSLIAIYIILKKYYLSESQKQYILSKMLYLLRYHNLQEELFLVSCLEICSLYSHNSLLIQNIEMIQLFMSDFDFPNLQQASFNCLMSIGYEGIKSLVELASSRTGNYQRFILNNLLQTPHLQKILIVRALTNDLYSNDSYRRHSCMAALSRMYDLLNNEEILKLLSNFFDDPKIEKILLASTIRNAGPLGEKLLLTELKENQEPSVRLAIASVFSYRFPKYPKYLTMKLDKNDARSIKKSTPGSYCKFIGDINFDVDEASNKNSMDSYLEVNTRDFLSSLKRMITIDYDHTNIQLSNGDSSPYILDFLNSRSLNYNNSSYFLRKYAEFFEIHFHTEKIDIDDIDDEGKLMISDEVIKALSLGLKDVSSAVRETAACSLGKIGCPESSQAMDKLIESIQDFDLNVRAKAIWAIGRIASVSNDSAVNSVLEALKTNFWKVKSACLFTLSKFGVNCAKKAALPLLKLLKESAINKQNVAETLVKLGYDGENALLRLMNTEDDANYKLKSAIAKAFALSDISSTNIDFIVECLFRSSKSNSFLIKQNSIFSIKVLAEKADENINYLKRKNLIPFFYELMKDKESPFQMEAIDFFKSIGAQGELIMIEGLTKDSSPIIRKNSAIGLIQKGPHNFRSVILALYDQNWSVRRTVEKEILENFKTCDIIEYFIKENINLLSIKFAIKDILEKELFTNKSTSLFFRNLLKEIQ